VPARPGAACRRAADRLPDRHDAVRRGLASGHPRAHGLGDPRLLRAPVPAADELDVGAELIVTDPGGTEAFRAPLARHWRIDDEDDHIIWIRPILAGYTEDNGAPAFNLSLARRRSLGYTTAELDGDAVVLHLRNDQIARVHPASGDALDELARWDTFRLARVRRTCASRHGGPRPVLTRTARGSDILCVCRGAYS
jgi:hypothetical protein